MERKLMCMKRHQPILQPSLLGLSPSTNIMLSSLFILFCYLWAEFVGHCPQGWPQLLQLLARTITGSGWKTCQERLMLSQLKLLGFTLVWQMCLSDIQGCSFPWVLCKLRGEKEPLLPSLYWFQLTYACSKHWLCLVPKTRLCEDVNLYKGIHPEASEARGGRVQGFHTPAHLTQFV